MGNDRKTSALRREIGQYIAANPTKRWMEIAYIYDVAISTITRAAKEAGLSRPVGGKKEVK